MIGGYSWAVNKIRGRSTIIPAMITVGSIAVAGTGLYMANHPSGFEMPILDALNPYLNSMAEYEKDMAFSGMTLAGFLLGSIYSKNVTTQE